MNFVDYDYVPRVKISPLLGLLMRVNVKRDISVHAGECLALMARLVSCRVWIAG
jgi:hypothetical protein